MHAQLIGGYRERSEHRLELRIIGRDAVAVSGATDRLHKVQVENHAEQVPNSLHMELLVEYRELFGFTRISSSVVSGNSGDELGAGSVTSD